MVPLGTGGGDHTTGVGPHISAQQVRPPSGSHVQEDGTDLPGNTGTDAHVATTALRSALWLSALVPGSKDHQLAPRYPQQAGWLSLPCIHLCPDDSILLEAKLNKFHQEIPLIIYSN